jgi:hypothetical protein
MYEILFGGNSKICQLTFSEILIEYYSTGMLGLGVDLMKKRVIIFGLVVLLVGMLPSVAAAGDRQTWYLYDDYLMYKNDDTKTAGEVTIAAGDSALWRAENAALADVDYDNGIWDCTVMVAKGSTAVTSFEAGIGSIHINPDSSWAFTSFGSSTVTDSDLRGKYKLFFITATTNFVIPAGDYLGFQISNARSDGSPVEITVRTGQSHGRIKSPNIDPGNPVPELPTYALLGAGLLLLGGWYWLRRRISPLPS